MGKDLINLKIVKIYLKFLLLITAINIPISTFGTVLGFPFRDLTVYYTLILSIVIDSLLILSYINKIKFNKLEILLIFLIFNSLLIGVINNHLNFGRQFLTDLLFPLFFILKISLFRNIFKRKDAISFIKKNLAFACRLLLIFSFISLFVLFLFKDDINYIGNSIYTSPYLIISFLKSFNLKVLFTILINVFSGKRAILLASIIIVLFGYLFIKRKFPFSVILTISLSIFFIFTFIFDNADNSKILGKYITTYENLMKNDLDNKFLDIATAGRYGEIIGVLEQINSINFFIGSGVGFTYNYVKISGDLIEYHNNVHFTPLGLISKYGFIFFFLIYIYMIKNLIKIKSYNLIYVFFSLYIIGLIIELFFAYHIFIDPFLAIAIGFLESYKNYE